MIQRFAWKNCFGIILLENLISLESHHNARPCAQWYKMTPQQHPGACNLRGGPAEAGCIPAVNK